MDIDANFTRLFEFKNRIEQLFSDDVKGVADVARLMSDVAQIKTDIDAIKAQVFGKQAEPATPVPTPTSPPVSHEHREPELVKPEGTSDADWQLYLRNRADSGVG